MLNFKKYEGALSGEIQIQGDKDISFLSLIISSLAEGESKIYNLPETENVLNLINILSQFGTSITQNNDHWVVKGKGLSAFKEPTNVIDVSNSKEILYLLIGLLSSYNFKMFFKGSNVLSDANLEDIINIFKKVNVKFDAREEKKLPFLMIGNNHKSQINYEIYEYNSILKNSLLLASLITSKTNRIVEKEKSKDHLEILMKYFGINFEEHELGNKGFLSTKIGKEIIIGGTQVFSGKEINIASDTTISAFLSSLAILIPDSELILKSVLMNQYRDSFYRTLVDMGADINFTNKRIVCGEKVADITIKYGKLKDTTIPANRVYKMLDEYPFLILLACLSEAKIMIQGTEFIKTKDLENYNYMLSIIKELGINYIDSKDALTITGNLKNTVKKITLDKEKVSFNTALALLSFGFFTKTEINVNSKVIQLEFPNIKDLLEQLELPSVHISQPKNR